MEGFFLAKCGLHYLFSVTPPLLRIITCLINAVFLDCILYKTKPHIYRIWIFAEGSLVVILIYKFRLKLIILVDKARRPILAN